MAAAAVVLQIPLSAVAKSKSSSNSNQAQNTDGVLIAKRHASGMDFMDDVNEALKRAHEEHKYVFIDVGAPW